MKINIIRAYIAYRYEFMYTDTSNIIELFLQRDVTGISRILV